MNKSLDLNQLFQMIDEGKCSDFYNLIEQQQISKALSLSTRGDVFLFGGLSNCERKAVIHQNSLPFKALKIIGNIKSVFAHGDILGSVMALGIKRKKTGDIFINGNEAYIIVKEEMANYLQTHLVTIGKQPVSVSIVKVSKIIREPVKQDIKKINVSSMRIDVIVASGYHLARNKVVQLINEQKILINYQLVTKPSKEVSIGDIISLKHKGRIIIKSVGKKTKKGRLQLNILLQN